jgi:hypothetical protein
MVSVDDLLMNTSYKAIYLYETNSAYFWRDGKCQYFPYLSPNDLHTLRFLFEGAQKKFHIPGKYFGFSSQ